jgi:hypothetical protein
MKKFFEPQKALAWLCIAALAVSLSSCAFITDDGRKMNTLHEGETRPLVPYDTTSEVLSNDTSTPNTTVSDPSTTTVTPNSDATTSPNVDTTAPEETTVHVDIITYEFEVVTAVEQLGSNASGKSSRTLRYPKLTGLSNTAMQIKINDSLASLADIEFDARVTNVEEDIAAGITVKYEVTDTNVTYLGNNLLSVRSSAKVKYSNGSGDSEFAYSYLFNLSTGKTVSMAKLYSDFGSVMNLFKSGEFAQISGENNVTSTISLSEMMEQYKNYKLYSTYPASYFTPTHLVLIIELNAMSGYYAEFSVPLDKVNAYLNVSPTK